MSASFQRAQSRLGRLLGLVENSTTPDNRRLAVERMLHILHDHDCSPTLTTMIHKRIVKYLRSTSWEVRVTGSRLLGALARTEPLASMQLHCLDEQVQQQEYVRLVAFQIQDVLSNGQPLLSEESIALQQNTLMTKEDIAAQRRALMEHVGLSVSRTQLGTMEGRAIQEAIGSEVNSILRVKTASSSSSSSSSSTTASKKTKVTDIVSTMSVRQQHIQKRQRSLEVQSEQNKRRKLGLVLASMTDKENERVDLQLVLNELRHSLLDPTWEIRHGATLGLTEALMHLDPREVAAALSSSVSTASTASTASAATPSLNAFVEDCAVRCLCVLTLDRFCDYVNDVVVSPSQEIAGQLLSVLYHRWMKNGDRKRDVLLQHLETLVRAARAPWETRYGACVALKYLVSMVSHVEQSGERSGEDGRDDGREHGREASDEQRRVLQRRMLEQLLKDNDGDVQGVAAKALGNYVVSSVLPSSPSLGADGGEDRAMPLDSSWMNDCWFMLWNTLAPQQDIASSSSPIVDAVATFMHYQHQNSTSISSSGSNTVLFPLTTSMLERSMFVRFLLHGLASVRWSALQGTATVRTTGHVLLLLALAYLLLAVCVTGYLLLLPWMITHSFFLHCSFVYFGHRPLWYNALITHPQQQQQQPKQKEKEHHQCRHRHYHPCSAAYRIDAVVRDGCFGSGRRRRKQKRQVLCRFVLSTCHSHQKQ